MPEYRTRIDAWKIRVRALQKEAYALYLAVRDPRVPWYAKLLIGLVVAHTFSPIDLIPDFIPVLGILDDLLIVPLGIALALKLTPPEVMVDARLQAEDFIRQRKPVSRAGALIVIAIWVIVIAVVVWSIGKLVGETRLAP
jgi:uncharacterized membrane protein YkvA (DUF1232 family)